MEVVQSAKLRKKMELFVLCIVFLWLIFVIEFLWKNIVNVGKNMYLCELKVGSRMLKVETNN